ncbi:MAG: hypothetical protein KGH57_04205 [Candidatus Micrarchaeota archaeon]|nr:hypothetical protein [Candidatus Micrarchaeota archaeon]
MAWWLRIDQKSDKEMVARAFSILRNRRCIEEERASLISRLGKDEYVAYFGGRLVDHDKDLDALSGRLAKKYPEQRKSMAVERLGGEK